jgi:lipopolysaccharide transport system permease protein
MTVQLAQAATIPNDHATPAKPRKVIAPPTGWSLVKLRELWEYRELLFFFTLRDIQIRYKQTLFGAAWAIIQPTMMMVVFTLVLGRVAKVGSGSLPYPVFVYAGLLPWTFFASAVTNAGNSIVGAQHIITKIYFPRLVIPFAAVGAAVVDFLVAFVMLLALMLFYKVPFSSQIFLMFIPVTLMTLGAMGIGCLLAALNVAFRDFKYTIPFLVQIWLFATPTVYMPMDESPHSTTTQQSPAHDLDRTTATQPTSANPLTAAGPHSSNGDGFHAASLLRLNPMTSQIEFFRATILGGTLQWDRLLPSAALIVGLFFLGVLYFRRVESKLADII